MIKLLLTYSLLEDIDLMGRQFMFKGWSAAAAAHH